MPEASPGMAGCTSNLGLLGIMFFLKTDKKNPGNRRAWQQGIAIESDRNGSWAIFSLSPVFGTGDDRAAENVRFVRVLPRLWRQELMLLHRVGRASR